MALSITLNNHINLQSQFLTTQQNEVKSASSNTNNVDVAPHDTASLKDFRYSSKVSNIDPVEIKALYEQIKKESSSELELFNTEGEDLKPFDYFSHNIENIMTKPIEVKIERDEVNTAILYNSLGINFLDVKRIEVRMELLEIAKEEVNEAAKAGGIREDERDLLQGSITNNMNVLLEEKQALLERKHIKNNEDALLEQLKRSQLS